MHVLLALARGKQASGVVTRIRKSGERLLERCCMPSAAGPSVAHPLCQQTLFQTATCSTLSHPVMSENQKFAARYANQKCPTAYSTVMRL